MYKFNNTLLPLFLSSLFIPNMVLCKGIDNTANQYSSFSGWSNALKLNSIYQFDSDLDNGGSFSRSKFNMTASRNYLWNRQTSATVALNYNYYDYDFSGGNSGSLAESKPWNQVHSLSLSAPLRNGYNDRWSSLVLPSVRFTGEANSKFNDSLTAGVFAAAIYQFSDNLSLGPGFSISSQLEDSISLVPLLIVRWDINDNVSLNTGNNSDSGQGPGLTLSYTETQKLKYSVGVYYNKLRFRLDNSEDADGGIGEDISFPLVVSATYNFNPAMKLTLIAGVELASDLSLEDSDGDAVSDDSSTSGFIGGLTFSTRL